MTETREKIAAAFGYESLAKMLAVADEVPDGFAAMFKDIMPKVEAVVTEAHERGRREGWDARGKADRQAALDYGMDETVKHSNRAVQHNAALGISHAISALPYDKEGA